MLFFTIAWAVIKAVFTGEIKHWWLAYEAHKAVQEKLNDRNIQNAAFNNAPGVADKFLHEHTPADD